MLKVTNANLTRSRESRELTRVVQLILVIVVLGLVLQPQPVAAFASCNDDRDTIIAEYLQFEVSFHPGCADFTTNAHSIHFTFAELNSGDYSWAILRQRMLDGLEQVRLSNGGLSLTINSGYRNPRHNAGIAGAAKQSQHMQGNAADIASNTETWQILHDHGKAANACVEPLDVSGVGHVHVDWRGVCPSRW